ncbi:MAG: hypothetical protein I3273_03835 [Candidatus Moeniiplasma glomeromycotorum]|nr:hypothetical protein [Candidatus Moeniiplasma glomeromycotorum]MCE8169225.1 hypothetical protein [Candidatus Moeniiplasma glomeromycotorum]
MTEVLIYVLIIIGVSLPPVIAVLLDHYFKKKKLVAETKKIQLQNKITEEITYDQLKKDNKHKDIKNKIEILSRLTQLEEEIKNKDTKTDSDQKKLAALECLKKEFKETLVENGSEPEKTLLVKKKNPKKSKWDKKV